MYANILLLVKLLPNGFSIHGCLNQFQGCKMVGFLTLLSLLYLSIAIVL